MVRGTSSPYRHMFYVYAYMYMIVHDIFLFAYVCNLCITVHSVSNYICINSLICVYMFIYIYILYIVFFVAHVKSLCFTSSNLKRTSATSRPPKSTSFWDLEVAPWGEWNWRDQWLPCHIGGSEKGRFHEISGISYYIKELKEPQNLQNHRVDRDLSFSH